ncbi:putative dsRNA-binding protein [Luteimonas sp. A501]
MLENWESLGKATVAALAARSILGSAAGSSVGSATTAISSLRAILSERLSAQLLKENLVQYGAGVTAEERLLPQTARSVAHQVIGAYCHRYGFAETKKLLLHQDIIGGKLEVPIDYDAKTDLQELYQRHKWSVPKYETIAREGPQHDQIFTVRVSDLRQKSATAEGASKRLAEQAAARNFIRLHFTKELPHRTEVLSQDFDPKTEALRLSRLPNVPEAQNLARAAALDDWTDRLISHAFVHSSYVGAEKPRSRLGKDNKLLALLGSQVLQWASSDALLRLKSPSQILEQGGISQLVKIAVKDETLVLACRDLFDGGLPLVGPGETSLRLGVKAEMVQALFGTLFLSRESSLVSGEDVIAGIPSLQGHFERVASRGETKDQLTDAKTRLQERCQAVGVRVAYQTKREAVGSWLVVTPRVRLTSERTGSSLSIHAEKVEGKLHDIRTVKDIEGDLAEMIVSQFDASLGLASSPTRRSNAERDPVEKWLISQVLSNLSDEQSQNARSARIGNLELLGIRYLHKQDFFSYRSFLVGIYELAADLDTTILESLYRFYENAGRSSKATADLQERLISDLTALQDFLQDLDPLLLVESLRETSEFRSLVAQATSCRLASGAVVEASLEEIGSQAELLLRRRGMAVSFKCDAPARVLEVQGAHLYLIDLLCHEALPENSLAITHSGGVLRLSLNAGERAASYLAALQSNSLWCVLVKLLPITQNRSAGGAVIVDIASVCESGVSRFALRSWLSYQMQGQLETVAKDAIASVLHDVKNELLAFESIAREAQASRSVQDKYSLASTATRHADQANLRLEAIRALIRYARKIEIAKFSVDSTMRSLSRELWEWMPSEIAFTPPQPIGECPIWASEEVLRSILSNIARNSVDAMSGRGKLDLDYIIADDSSWAEFEVNDTGPGFTDEQLRLLNSGIPIESSKRHGPGIGLLTVLMLARDVGGSIRFERNAAGGTRFNLKMPCAEPLRQAVQTQSSTSREA